MMERAVIGARSGDPGVTLERLDLRAKKQERGQVRDDEVDPALAIID